MGLPTCRHPATRGPEFLRSKGMGAVWVGLAILVGILLWQQIFGWPLQRRVRFTGTDLRHAEGTILEVRLPDKEAPSAWTTAFARLTENTTPLARCVSKEQFDTASPGAWWIKGRSIYLRPLEETPGSATDPVFEITLPRLCSTTSILLIAGGFLLWTAVLAWAGNLQLRGWISRCWNPSTRETIPWVTATLAGLAVLTAVLLRASGVSFPAVFSDTKDYLKPALLWAAGGKLISSPDRPFGYPLALGLILRIVSDFRAVVTMQGVATVLTAAAIGGLIWQSGLRLFEQPIGKALARILGASAFALFTLHEGIVEREWALLPEAWACIYMGLQLWLAWSLTSRERTTTDLLLRYTALCAAGWMLAFTKPNWALALAMLPIPLLIAGALRQPSWRGLARWTALAAVILGAISLLAAACQIHFTPGGTLASLDQRARVLVCWHAPMVRLEITRRLAEAPNGRDSAVLAEVGQVLDEAFALAKSEGSGAYPALGYDADRLFYIGFKKATLYQQLPRPERTALFNELFVSALRRHPAMYFRKVLAQMAALCTRPYGPATIYRPGVLNSLERSEWFLTNAPDYWPVQLRERYAQTLLQARRALAGTWPSAGRLGLSIRISVIFEALTRTFPWAAVIPILILGVAAAWPRWRQAIHWKALAPVLCTALWATGSILLSALTSSVAQALEIQRYIDFFLPLTLFAQILWPLIGLSLLLQWHRPLPHELAIGAGRHAVGPLESAGE
jgi:hypothetical protein